MKIRSVLFVLALAFVVAPAFAQKGFKKIIVDQNWMQKHIDDENLVILHVGDTNQYVEGHIKSSRYINAPHFTRVVGDLYWELPEPEVLNKNLRERGVDKKSKIVLVHGGNGHAATFRLYFTLDYFGLSKNVVILDGGLKGWKANNHAVTTAVPEVKVKAEGQLVFKPNPSIKVDKDYVNANSLKDEINVIDARRPAYYEGNGGSHDSYTKSGHIPGAENICWLDIVDENLFMKDLDTLKAYYEEAGAKKKEEVVAYCHVGLRASVIYTVAKGLGYKVRLYDGSFNEWDTLSDEYPTKKGKESK